MAIDLSNIGPGGGAAADVAKQRRQRLAAAKARPVAGPGAAGLGIGGNIGLQYKPHNVFNGSTPMPYNSLMPTPDYSPETIANNKFANIDTMLFKDRLAPARAFAQTQGSAFNLKQSDVKSMINAGFLSYGKGGDMKYAGLTSSASPQALNELLRTNYTQRGNKWVRTNPSLKVTPNTLSYLAYGGLSSDTNAAIDQIAQGKVVRSASSPALDYEGMPKIGKAKDAGINYQKMAEAYGKDQEQQATWESKISKKIQSEGGSALWNQIMTGKYTAQDVLNLRQYMYSPNGDYGPAQEKFIQETLLNNGGSSPAALIEQRDVASMKALNDTNIKEQNKALEKQAELTKQFYDKHLDPKITTPDGRFDSIVNGIAMGEGNIISTGMIDQVMRDGAGTYVTDNKVTGGKRFVPAPLRGFTEAQKATLIDAVMQASDAGFALPAGLKPYLDPMIQNLTVQEGGSDDNSKINNAIYRAAASNSMLAPIVGALGLGVAATKTETGQKSMSDLEKLSHLSYLQPTQNPNAGQWAGNWLKGAARFGTGFMPGMFYMATDPAGTTKAMVQDYYTSYSNWDNFKAKVANDPLSVTLDALSLVDGIGIGLKGAQVASATSRLAKGGEVLRAAEPVVAGQEWKIFDPQYNTNLAPDAAPINGEFAQTGGGISRTDYAKLMRDIANGDQYAKLRLESLLPKGTNASNSLLMPTFMDRAAGFFEPRYKFVTRTDGNKTMVDQARQSVLQDQVEGTTFRFSGSPISRGVQRAMFTAQTKGGLMSGRIANLPLLGYNYRFDKAMTDGHLSVNEAVRREMGMLNLYHKAVDDMGLADHEQQMIMNEVAGGAYSPAVYSSIIRRKLAENAQGMNVDTKTFLEAELKKMEDPQRLADIADAKVAMVEGVSPRGIELAKAHTMMLMLLEKQNRLLSAFDNPANIQAALTAYQPLTTAAKLNPADMMRELGADGNNLAMFNPNWHFAEQAKVYAENFVFENGQFRPITKGDTAHMASLEQMKKDMEYIRQDHSFRNLAGHPHFIVDNIIRDAKGDPLLVQGRRLRVEGNIGQDLSMERLPLVDPRPLTLPASAFVPVENAAKGVMTLSRDQAAGSLHIGAVNTLNKLFPNVRDFVDKISDRSVNTSETFKQRENRNIVVSTGIQDYHMKVQFKAHASYLQKRVADGWQTFFDTTSYPVRAGEFNPDTMVANKTAKLFDSQAAAEAYAANYDAVGAIEPGVVSEVTVGGKTMYKTGMRYFDTMKSTVQEQRTKQLTGTNNYEKDYLQSVKDLTNLDPNEIIMVVPKSTYTRFKASQLAVDANLKEIFFPNARKVGNLFNSIFKIGVLSLNPHFIPQSIVGSSMMVGLATPELFPKTMAGLMQLAARRGKAKLTKTEADAFSNHVDDFEYMTRTSPHEFDNVYHADVADSFGKKLGDSKLAKYTIYNGYTVVFAFESNMRVAMMRAAAMKYPGFKSLMKSNMAKDRAAKGLPDLGLETLSPFQAAFEMLRDSSSPLHDPNFMHEVTHTADGALGNYRDFSSTEKAVRNYLIPFYAWQRHSALFTKRLFQERPLAANAAYNLGNYGFEKTVSAGGVPDWLYETVPMPDQLQKILQMNPMSDNRISLGSVNPFGTATDSLMAGASLFAGQGLVQSSKNLADFTSPFINNIVAQTTGVDPRTGVPLTADERNKGFVERTLGTFEGFPAIANIVNTFKSYDDMNARRGMSSAEDIFVDPGDPNSKLSIPKDKLAEKFSPLSAAGLFNVVSPVRAMSLNAEQVAANYRKQMADKGMKLPAIVNDQTALEKNITSLLNWKRKASWIQQYWVPAYGKDAVLSQRVQAALSKEFPKLPQGFPPELYAQIMNGGG